MVQTITLYSTPYTYISTKLHLPWKMFNVFVDSCGACIQLARLGVKFISVETHASKLTLVVKKKKISDEQYSIAEV